MSGQPEYRPTSPFPIHWLLLGGAATYMLSKRPEKEILEVTGQDSKEAAYMMTIGVFVACFCVSTFVRNQMMGTRMSLFGSGGGGATTPPMSGGTAAPAPAPKAVAAKKEPAAAASTSKGKKKSKKAD